MAPARAADTVFALSTAPGRAAIAVLRISGPEARVAIEKITARPLPPPLQAALRRLRGSDGEEIDRGLLLYFEGPASYTGEDLVELHVHGGRAVLEKLSAALVENGLRPAEAGEFTRRAVANGKLDLTRAEAIADLIDAETEAQRRQAVDQYEGGLSRLCERWRSKLIRALALVEAAIDFLDEELPGDILAQARAVTRELAGEIEAHLADGRRGEILREGVLLTVIGPPNAGKSSFINALARRDVAIVSPEPGTTRDIIEVRLDLKGYPVIVADTAGLREAEGTVESEGVRRALARAREGDLVLLLLDGTDPDDASRLDGVPRPPDLIVWNKSDLAWPRPQTGLVLSLRTSAGLDGVIDAIADRARDLLERPRAAHAVLTRSRHRLALTDALAALRRAEIVPSTELFAEDLRLAARAVGRITGAVDIEEVLDSLFREFCIGK